VSEHASPRTRAAAVRALGASEPGEATLRRLREAAADPDAWVRYYACQALGNLRDPSSTAILSSHVEDPAGQVRVAAVDALARLSGPPAFEVLAAPHDTTTWNTSRRSDRYRCHAS
jgi:HEAT repeat protein